MVRGCKYIPDHMDLTEVLDKLGFELHIIVWQKDLWSTLGHDSMGYKSFFHALGCDRPKWYGTFDLRVAVRYSQEVFVVLWGCHEFSQDVD